MKLNLRQFLIFTTILLSQALFAQDAGLTIAKKELSNLATEKRYLPSDISELTITDDYVSGGIRHIYYQQTVDQVGIYGTSGSVHLKENEVVMSNLEFLSGLEKRDVKSTFQIQALEAVVRLAVDKGYPLSQTEIVILENNAADPDQSTTISPSGISNRKIPLKLVYMINDSSNLQLAWSVFIDEKQGGHYKNFLVDAGTGAVLLEKDLTITCAFDHDHDHSDDPNHQHHKLENPLVKNNQSENKITQNNQGNSLAGAYNVIPFSTESPNHGPRMILTNPWENNVASPNGWHSALGVNYTHTYGNNVDAYSDSDNTNLPTGGNSARADGGANLNFNFNWTATGNQAQYKDAAVTNLFYVSNVAHDVFYNYGFDEASGNFQTDNYNKGGNEEDNVLAEAQDGLGTCNANFSTPVDGTNPRMQMYLCSGRDGDFDNGVILHEYGHGISTRLTGGPDIVNCLFNQEQMGEGWSDFFGMLLTMQPGETSTTQRTIGTWLFNQAANGPGLRPYPYTTDMTVNPMTYDFIKDDVNISQPHGIGAVWATMLWDLNWALIDQYGWDADLYNGTGGNNIALRLVIEGLKMQSCSPGFTDGRDAILAADMALYNGIHRCIIWEVFSRRGLGYSANQGSSKSRYDGTEGYDLPPECTIELVTTVEQEEVYLGERLTFHLEASNNLDVLATNIIVRDTLPDNVQFYSASDGGILNGNVVQWPAFDLGIGASKVFELKVTVNDNIIFDPDFLDAANTGDIWEVVNVSGTNYWARQSQYSYSPSNAWYSPNANTVTETHLVLKKPLGITATSQLSFNHMFDLEFNYDFGLVDISLNGGVTWINLESKFIQNGYNKLTYYGQYGFNGDSEGINGNDGGYIHSVADLSAYAGEVALIRFRLLTDVNTANLGWAIDDIAISDTKYALPSYGNIGNNEFDFSNHIYKPAVVNHSVVNHTVETAADILITYLNASIAYSDVQANDIDPDGPTDILVTTIITQPTNGVATILHADSIGYVPNTGFIGNDRILYEVCDVLESCERDTLFIIVEEKTTTVSDYLEINENSAASTVDVQANDSQPNGGTSGLITTIITAPAHGTASVINNNSIEYTPTTDYFGLDLIIYQVCYQGTNCSQDTIFITILENNDSPITNTDYLEINENAGATFINVLANDSDPNGAGDFLITNILVAPLHGTASVINNDSIQYVPTMDYFGLDMIIYQACDTAAICVTDTVFITILENNDAPITQSDYLEINENSGAAFINVLANDSDPDGLGDSLITNILVAPLHGTASVINNDSIQYVPTTDYFGLDMIIYQACDTAAICVTDTVFITIKAINKPPVAVNDYLVIDVNTVNAAIYVQLNDNDPNGVGDSLITSILTDVNHGTTQIYNENFILYTPTPEYLGLDTLIYQVCDTANICASASVFIRVKEINLAPITASDEIEIDENSALVYIPVQGNDSDPNGGDDTLKTNIYTQPTVGIATVIDMDSISYMPYTGYFGLDTIIYEVCDTSNLCAKDTVFITINNIEFAPITAPDYLIIEENTLDSYIDVQANDIDSDLGDTLVTTIIAGPNNGMADVIDNDSIQYDPDTDYLGLDTIIYQVCDLTNLCAIDTIFIRVKELNLAPITGSDYLDIEVNTLNSYINVQANDIDPNGGQDTLLTSILVPAKNGSTVVIDSDSIKYTPIADFIGLDTIIYQVCDTSNLCVTDTVFISVNKIVYICGPQNLTENTNDISSGRYVASSKITSAGVVKNGADVLFVANTSITLLPGFEVNAGAEFTALIDKCESSTPITEEEIANTDRSKPLEEIAENSLLVRPNPFRNEAIIDYQLGENGSIWIGLYDVTGKLMIIFVNQNNQRKGVYQYNLSAEGLAGGVYWVTMKTKTKVLTKKVFVLGER